MTFEAIRWGTAGAALTARTTAGGGDAAGESASEGRERSALLDAVRACDRSRERDLLRRRLRSSRERERERDKRVLWL